MKSLRMVSLICSLMLVSCLNGSQPSGSTAPANKPAQTKGNNEASEQYSESPDQQRTISLLEHPVVNVYLETSGSMNGYVNNGKSQFQQAVYDYVSNINNSKIPSTMNLYYITDKITDAGNNISSFINSLTPNGLLKAKGNKSTTDLADLFSTILERTDNNTVSVFVSDCIFSPGSVSDPDQYLENQKITIRNAVTNYLDSNINLACCVYQFNSTFNGTYYDYLNRGRKINQSRPFYIWVFGNVANIYKLRLSIPQSNFMGATVNKYWAIYNNEQMEELLQPKYGLLQPNPRNGKYKWANGNVVSKLGLNDGHMYQFTFGADMSVMSTILGEDYVENMDNYKNLINKQTNDEFKSSCVKNTVKSSPFTYDFHVYSDKRPAPGKVTFVFDGNVPAWVYLMTDSDDSKFNGTNDFKTYGFSYICDGIYAGFHANNTNNIVAQFQFEIK